MPLDQQDYQIPAETKHDVFSLEGLMAWLEKQPAHKTYCWERAGECLYSQYGAAAGVLSSETCSIYFNTVTAFRACDFRSSSVGEPFPIALQNPHTFGAALTRARKLLAERAS